MVIIKQKDFVELNYIGKIKLTNQVFDLTDKEEAKKINLLQEGFKYGPRVICVGEKEVISGIDNALIGKEVPSKLYIEIKPEEAFGRRDDKLMKTINTDILIKQKINPFPGLQLAISGMMGTIRSVSRGRTIIDFNHPLAGKELIYELEIKSIVTDNKIKLSNLFENSFKLASSEYTITYDNNKAIIKTKAEIPQQFKQGFEKKAKFLIKELEVKFE